MTVEIFRAITPYLTFFLAIIIGIIAWFLKLMANGTLGEFKAARLWVLAQERLDQLDDLLRLIFLQEVARSFEVVLFCMRVHALPGADPCRRDRGVLHPPDDRRRNLDPSEVILDPAHSGGRWMLIADRYIPRKRQRPDTGVPIRERSSVRRHERIELLLVINTRWEETFHEQVQSLDHRLANLWLAE